MTDPRIPLRRLRDSLADRVDTAEVDELFAVGEWLVGLEALASQIYEDELALTAEELRLVDEAAAGWAGSSQRRAAQFAAASLRAAGPRGADGRWPVRLVTAAHFHGDLLREAWRMALGLPDGGAEGWRGLPVTSGQLPHLLDIRDWDVLRAAHPEDARGLLEWVIAATASGDFAVVISDSEDRSVDPREELRRL